MLQFNLLRPEWTGIIKQNLSYGGEPVSFISVVLRLGTGQQENMVRFSTKVVFSLSHFMWANPASCSMNTRSSFLRDKTVRFCRLLSSGTESFYLQVDEASGRTAFFKCLPCRKLSVPNNTHFHLLSIFKKSWSSTSIFLTWFLTFYLMTGSGTKVMSIVFSENLNIIKRDLHIS
jgi:hypothetical protein